MNSSNGNSVASLRVNGQAVEGNLISLDDTQADNEVAVQLS